jgi:hypothetical protein
MIKCVKQLPQATPDDLRQRQLRSMDHLTQFQTVPGLYWAHQKEFRVPFHNYETHRQFKPAEFWAITGKHLNRLKEQGPVVIQNDLDCDPAQFVQSWLFFALLAMFLDEDVDSHMFTGQGFRYLETARLPAQLRRWKVRITASPRDQQTRLATLIDTALEIASQFISKWHEDTSLIPANLWLSVAALGETLAHVKNEVWPSTETGYWHVADERRWGEHQHITKSLIASGWSPRCIRNIQQSMGGVSGPFITSMLSPTPEYKNCSDPEVSGRKSLPYHAVGCDWKSHEEFTSGCPLLSPRHGSIEEILEQGNLPVIRLDRKKAMHNGKPSEEKIITVLSHSISAKEPQRCVAISHVWSDGLGNEKENSLPLCQLEDLQNMVNRIDGDEFKIPNTPFWLDTICIPVAPPTFRNKGIRSIGIAFEKADKVLVLDNDLRGCDQIDGLEPLIRINLSKWVTRVWTLQEASLAKDLNFEFKGKRAVGVRDLEDRLEKAGDHLHLSWLKAARIFNPAMRSLRKQSEDNKVTYVWQAVNGRSCDKPKDETLCLASLLNIDQMPLLEVHDSDERMCRFLSMLDYIGIPPGIVFLQGDRMKREGFRWAPRTWRSGLGQQFPYPMSRKSDDSSLLMRNGLLVRYPGILLQIPRRLSGKTITVWTENEGRWWYQLEYLCPEGDDSAGSCPWTLLQKDEQWRPAIILCRLPVQSDPEIALLVSIVQSREDIEYVHHLCHLKVKSITSPSEIEKAQHRLYQNDDTIPGVVLKQQRWCVDGPPVTSSRLYATQKPTHLMSKGESARVLGPTQNSRFNPGTDSLSTSVLTPSKQTPANRADMAPPKRHKPQHLSEMRLESGPAMINSWARDLDK